MGVKFGSYHFVGSTKVERSQLSPAQHTPCGPSVPPPSSSIVSAPRQVTKEGLQAVSPTSVWYPTWDEFC